MSANTADVGGRQIKGLATLQRFGRSLMLPIAVLPAAGLLLRFGQPDMLGEKGLGWNAVAPGVGGTSSVSSTAEPGTIVYSLQGPVFKVENGLPTAINYSATAKLDLRGQEMTQAVKTCTIAPGRVGFEMWSAGVKVASMVVGVPVAHNGAPGCAS